ncbi:MAG: C40 family peptidase [Eubacteriales bacterium]|nr:C40 family peptidase [Eubacteriales bacterium]
MKKNQTSILTSINVVTSALDRAAAKAKAGSNTSAVNPVKTGTTGANPSSSGILPAASTANRAGQTAQKVYLAGQGVNDAVFLNERQALEAQLVRQLPKDFPIQNWESMPVKAQVFAMQQSGLSKEEQWTLLNATAPFKVLVTATPIVTSRTSNAASYEKQPGLKLPVSVRPDSSSGSRNTGSSGGQQSPFSGQDAETQRAEQRASRQATDAYHQLNEALESKNVDASSLSGTGNDIYKSTRIAMANAVLQGTLDSSKQSKMIEDASAGIASGKTAPKTVQDWNERVAFADTESKKLMDTLDSVHVDTDHLTTQQSYIIEKAERMLRDGIISGTLTKDGANEMIRRICNNVTSETTPPKGVTYVTLFDPKLDLRSEEAKRNQIMIRRGAAFNQAGQLLDDALEGINVDTSKMSDQQKRIVLAEQQNLADGMLNGSIKGDAINEFVDTVCYRIATETTPPPGVTYVTIMDPGYKRRMEAEKEERKEEKKKSDIEFNGKVISTTKEMDNLLKNEIGFDIGKLTEAQKTLYNNAIRDIRNKLMNGQLTEEDKDQIFHTLANRLSTRVYEYEYRNAYGKKALGTVTTDELINPEDNSDGARAARYILEPVAQKIGYNDPTILNPHADPNEKRKWINIDCSGLVKYAVYQINPDWAVEIFGNVAKYQMDRTGNNVVWQKTDATARPNIEDMRAGDLLYWADESGEVVHTAMYIGEGFMVESAKAASLTEVRFTTVDGDGSKSELVQINRLDEGEVSSYGKNFNN